MVSNFGALLRRVDVVRDDRVALVLPNGPEAASAFLATATHACSAPLNPNYSAAEFEFYLGDLEAKAVLVPAAADTPARDVATKRKGPRK